MKKRKFDLNRLVVFFWTTVFLLSVAALVSVNSLFGLIETERQAEKDSVALVSLGYQLRDYSNYLTAEARNFVVTANIHHLQNYWDEVLVGRHRDQAVEALKTFPASHNVMHLLVKSKRNSDALIQTEERAMKLVLLAYDIDKKLFPESLRRYHLNPKDLQLDQKGKISLAQQLMFDHQYYLDKQKIMAPIKQFNQMIYHTSKQLAQQTQKRTQNTLWLLYTLICILAFAILCIVWIRVKMLSGVSK